MKKNLSVIAIATFSPFLSLAAGEGDGEFVLKSKNIAEGGKISNKHVFNGFGCEGENIAPEFVWQNTPKGTKSYALTAFDPDAPTGSGWWHWQVYNIPAVEFKLNAANNTAFTTSTNDYGQNAYGGPCPPKTDGFHRYEFTVHALGVEKLDVPDNASAALISYMINTNSLVSSTITAIYDR